jgi:hypothetical protein
MEAVATVIWVGLRLHLLHSMAAHTP